MKKLPKENLNWKVYQERMDHYKSAYSCASEEELHQLVRKIAAV